VLTRPDIAEVVLESFDFLRRENRIKVIGFCIMPDHYHVLFFVLPGMPLQKVMGSIGKFTARKINATLRRSGLFWQDGFYDHRCRDEDDLIGMLSYVEHNPVRAGIVQAADQWLWSSAHCGQQHRLNRDWFCEVR
jgi:REP element-mobilizing transposase RayT